MKEYKPGKIVKDVLKDWAQMAGDTDQERKLNAYLTAQFITRKEMLADECVNEARKILAFVRGEKDILE